MKIAGIPSAAVAAHLQMIAYLLPYAPACGDGERAAGHVHA